MASQKAKRIMERLAQIKDRASQMNANGEDGTLAEEAAGLGLELADLFDKKEKS